MTTPLYRDDAYLETCNATVTEVTERGGIVLDQTVFYPTGGGQPGDTGSLMHADGRLLEIATTVTDRDTGNIVHVPGQAEPIPAFGDVIVCQLDVALRRAHMRTHTALHLLCSLVPFPVTGGQIGVDRGRLDFDIPDAAIDKDDITSKINQLIADDRAVSTSWITDEELTANPDLVRTMSVKPPMGHGRIRMVRIDDCDYQPCGGTHVASTGEIGTVKVTKVEKKGAQNRRIRIEIA